MNPNELDSKLSGYDNVFIKKNTCDFKRDISNDSLTADIMEFFRDLLRKNDFSDASVFDYVEFPLIAIDALGNIQVFNKAMENLTNLKYDNVKNNNIIDVLGRRHLITVQESRKNESSLLITLNGQTMLSVRFPLISHGRVTGSIAVLIPIAEMDDIIKELDYSKHLSREIDAIFESSFDGLYITDGEANTLRLNKGFERITGLSAEQCIGRNMRDLVAQGIYSRSGTLMALKKRERIMTTLETNTGKTVLATSNPIFDADNNITLVVTDVCDITELIELQRKTEEAQEDSVKTVNISPLELNSSRKFIVHSPQMRELVNMCNRVAATESNVLIQGESGVGKELIADLIHSYSNRKNGPLVKVNCGAIPENLLESELFGYETGAFTGASKDGKAGMFETASGGTLFLDEIGDLPLNLQVKLLRAIQEREIIRVGGVKAFKIDLRILAGTNRNLEEMVADGLFRQDLYYRLNVVPVYVPALRERPDDIQSLSHYFLDSFNEKYQMHKQLSPEIISCFMDYSWPGNVRELENFIERLVVTSNYDTITVADLLYCSEHFRRKNEFDEEDIVPLRTAVENTERLLLQKAFLRYSSSYEVAKVLGVNQSTVIRKAARYGINRD